MGLGIFKLAATVEQDFELHGFQVPYGWVPASAFAGFGLNIGGKLVTIIGKTVSIGGEPFTGSSSPLGLTIVNTHSERDTVKYVSPDKSVHFESTWKKLTTPPGYLLNFKVYIDAPLIAKEGVCGSKDSKTPLLCNNGLFNKGELASLNALLPKGVSDCKVDQPKEATPEEACKAAGISYAAAVSKCSALKNDAAFFSSCIFDYCASKGDDSMVAGAVESQIRQSISPEGTTQAPKFVGCFKDSWDRDLPKNAGNSVFPAECQTMCTGYKYFAIQAAVECWCGNAYGKHGPASGCDCETEGWKGAAFKSCIYEEP